MRKSQRGSNLLLSLCGTGSIKGGGTLASLAVLLLLFFFPSFSIYLFILSLLTGVVLTWNMADRSWIVLDEACGMSLALVFLKKNPWLYLSAFLLFRVFDIWKPPFLKKLEKLKGGIMWDDVVAVAIAGILTSTGEVIWRHLYL